jgi:hypothetical protein
MMGFVNFMLWHPLGETLLLIALGVYLWRAHQKGRVHGRAYLEIAGFIAATVVGFWIPTFVVFAITFFYVVRRLRQAHQETNDVLTSQKEMVTEVT